MAPALVQHTAGDATLGAVSLGVAPTAGNTLILVIASVGGPIDTIAGWVERAVINVPEPPGKFSTGCLQIWSHLVAPGDPASWTIFAGGPRGNSYDFEEWSGLPTAYSVGVATFGPANSDAISVSLAVTASVLAVGLMASYNSNTPTTQGITGGGGFTQTAAYGGSGGGGTGAHGVDSGSFWAGYNIGAGPYTLTGTVSPGFGGPGNDTSYAILVAVEPITAMGFGDGTILT